MSNTELRLKRIADKGWEVAQRLAKVKANQNMVLADMKGVTGDDEHERPEDRLRNWLDQINRARVRLNSGDYGKCLGCGTPLADGALDDMPWVENCATCDAA